MWRAKPKWVVSRSLKSVGANATLVASDAEAFVRRLKAEVEGEIDVAGPELAGCLTDLGLIVGCVSGCVRGTRCRAGERHDSPTTTCTRSCI